MQSFDVTIRNDGDSVLVCDSSIAHWFSHLLGEVAPGHSLRVTLYADAEDGTVFLRNEIGDDMPVQRIWCGLKGQSWVTRAEIPLDRRAGEIPLAISLACAARVGGTVCVRQ